MTQLCCPAKVKSSNRNAKFLIEFRFRQTETERVKGEVDIGMGDVGLRHK